MTVTAAAQRRPRRKPITADTPEERKVLRAVRRAGEVLLLDLHWVPGHFPDELAPDGLTAAQRANILRICEPFERHLAVYRRLVEAAEAGTGRPR